MSRNFELLQQAEMAYEILLAPSREGVTENGRKPRLDWEALAREERMKFVQRLFLLPGSEAPRAVVFCGVESGDGSSWTCLRTGETLASQVKGTVCLVDANLRTPFLHEYFRTDSLRGLTEAILQLGPIRTFAHQVNGCNLWLVPCGSKIADPHALLTSDQLQARMAELKTEFDYVLVDGPPVNPYGDTSLLGKLADGVVLVVQANSTRREAAKKAKESLDFANVRVLGAVLNKRVFPIPDALYRWI